jgi:uncharacterized protein YjbI with pentapeptide repeats
MFDALFQALFTYRPVVFQQGEFRFDLTGASLKGADCSGADFRQAVLTGADLSRANFMRALMKQANLQDAEVRGARGLRDAF